MTASNENLVDRLIDDPSAWTFSPTDEEIQRVRDAYVAFQMSYDRVPDFNALRISIVGGFGGDIDAMLKFWDTTLLADLPDLDGVDPSMAKQVRELWRYRKIASIVKILDLEPIVEWDQRSISASIKSPDNLRRAADDLEQLDAEGFRFVSYSGPDEQDLLTWHMRRRRKVQ